MIGSFHQGGSERQAIELTRMLHEHGEFDLYAATLNNEGVLKQDIEAIGLPPIPEFRLASFYDTNFVRQVHRCSKFMWDNNIDVVHTHDFYTNVFGMAAARLAGVRARIASKRETGGMRSSPQAFVEKLAFRQASAIVANSGAVQAYLTSLGVNPAKIKVIYNGIDTARFQQNGNPAYQAFDSPVLPNDGSVRVVTLVANLRHDVKNVPMLIRAAKRVIDQIPETHFVIAGEGELELGLRALADRLDVSSNVHFLGRCTDVPALVASSNICVLTSSAEGFSNSILEYMAAGKPVVVTDVGGAREAVSHGESGYIVASDDDASMADRLVELLRDEARMVKFGIAGKQIISTRFSAQNQLNSTVKLYKSLIG